jgi:hypothetical protein
MKQLRDRRANLRLKGNIVDDLDNDNDVVGDRKEENSIYISEYTHTDKLDFGDRSKSVVISPNNSVKVPTFKWRKATVKPINTEENNSENC